MAAGASHGIAGKYCLPSERQSWEKKVPKSSKTDQGSIEPVIQINLGEQETQIFIWLHEIFGVVMPNWGFDFSCFNMTSLVWSRVLLVLRGYRARSGNTEYKLWFFSKLVTGVWLNAIRIGIKSRQTIFPGVILHRTDCKCNGVQIAHSFIISCFFSLSWVVGSEFLSLSLFVLSLFSAGWVYLCLWAAATGASLCTTLSLLPLNNSHGVWFIRNQKHFRNLHVCWLECICVAHRPLDLINVKQPSWI